MLHGNVWPHYDIIHYNCHAKFLFTFERKIKLSSPFRKEFPFIILFRLSVYECCFSVCPICFDYPPLYPRVYYFQVRLSFLLEYHYALSLSKVLQMKVLTKAFLSLNLCDYLLINSSHIWNATLDFVIYLLSFIIILLL